MLPKDEILKMMMSHLIQSIESDLGNYLRGLGVDVNSQVRDFLINRTKNAKDDQLEDPIANVYWLDLWELAAEIESDDRKKGLLKTLLKYAADETIRNARNSHGHGNQTFYKHYWYSVAAFATRPEMAFLGFNRLQEAIKRVESGDFVSDVILDDVSNYQIETPNNLPAPDWRDTGYIGRVNEVKKLEQELRQGRSNSICITGPGGVGKTAIALKVLQNLIFENVFDEVFYYSFKTEFLTSGGVLVEDNKITIQTVRDAINNYFDEKYEDGVDGVQTVCVCLDNIEDVTVEDSSAFDDFLEELPASWKVFATSRLKPNGFKVVNIDELDEAGCRNLARKYINIHGSREAILSLQTHEENLIKTCAKNPLAIKLALDLGQKDLDFSRSASESIKMVTNYSFKNLAEFFDRDTIVIMEFLRQAGTSTRSEIAQALQLPIDLVSESLNKIRHTSLLRTQQGGEGTLQYDNSDLTSNFLTNAEDIDGIRAEVNSLISDNIGTKTRIKEFNDKHFRSQHPFRLPEDAPFQCLDLVVALKKAGVFFLGPHGVKAESFQNLNNLLKAWNELPSTFKSSSYFLRVRGTIMAGMNDARAEKDLEDAVSIDETDTSYICFANHYFKSKRYDEAAEIYRAALQKFPDSISCGVGYCVNLTFTNIDVNRRKAAEFAHQKILENKTEFHASFLSAISRLAENGFLDVPKEQLSLAMDIYRENAIDYLEKDIFTRFVDMFCFAIFRFPNETAGKIDSAKLIGCFRKYQSLGGLFARVAAKVAMPSKDYLKVIFDRVEIPELLDDFILDEASAEIAVSDNAELRSRIVSGELMTARIARSFPNKGFCFARSGEGEEFFCHFSTMRKEFDGAEDLVLAGSTIALKVVDSNVSGRDRLSTEFYLIPEDLLNLRADT